MREMFRVIMATGLFAALHSALASQRAKAAAARLVGERAAAALYRPFYIAQSLLSAALLFGYLLRLPSRTLYRVRGPVAALMRVGQALAFAHAVHAARTVGIARITGLGGALDWLRGREVPEAPVAQGPERRQDGSLTTGGPFRWSRHPLNFSPVPIFWLTPHLGTRRLAFNVIGTLYLVLGSIHEERRLRAAYGEAYRRYQEGDVPFFVPGL